MDIGEINRNILGLLMKAKYVFMRGEHVTGWHAHCGKYRITVELNHGKTNISVKLTSDPHSISMLSYTIGEDKMREGTFERYVQFWEEIQDCVLEEI